MYYNLNYTNMKKFISLLLLSATITLVSCQETDKTIPVSKLTLNKTEITLIKDGKETLIAMVAPENATDKQVVWESSDTSVATVSEDGEVTAIKEGAAVITVTSVADKTQKATCNVVVAILPSGVTLNKTEIMLFTGVKESLTATVAPENATNKQVAWESSDASVATVSEIGEVMAIARGIAKITGTTVEGKKTASCVVTVIDETTARCQVVNNVTPVTSAIGADGTMYEANVIFYGDSAEIGKVLIGDVSPAGGKSPVILPLEGVTRARVSFKLCPITGTEYTVNYFALTVGGLTTITITDDTMLTSTKAATKGEPATMTLREALSRL